jgi:hypothetical protein
MDLWTRTEPRLGEEEPTLTAKGKLMTAFEERTAVPSKPLTLDLMLTFNFFSEGLAILSSKPVLQTKMKNMKVVEHFLI